MSVWPGWLLTPTGRYAVSLDVLESLDGVKSRITAFYQRVTAEESFKRNLSVPAQRAEAEELARRHGWAPFKLH